MFKFLMQAQQKISLHHHVRDSKYTNNPDNTGI